MMSTYSVLRQGSKGEEVRKLQQSLESAGYGVGASGVDGSFGPDTMAAVTKYQQDKGLKVDGIAGPETLGSLYGGTSTKQTTTEKSTSLMAKEALDALLNREEFSYDVNGDALYQQYKDYYVNQGRKAMADTMGQAAGLTGGYGSTYAQSAGQQTYQEYLQKLNNVIPELYQLAYERYQDEGDDLYDRYAVLAEQDDREYSREQDALENQWRQTEFDYQKSRDAASDAQWWSEFEYQQSRDAVSDQRWQSEFEYQQSRDAVSDQRWQSEFEEAIRQYDQNYGLEELELASKGVRTYKDYYDLLSGYQYKGSMLDTDGTEVEYDNGQVSTGNIMVMQRVLGLKEDGLWTSEEVKAAGGLNADRAWAAYCNGSLTYRAP